MRGAVPPLPNTCA